VTEILGDLPRYKMIKEKLECPSKQDRRDFEMVRGEYAGHQMDLQDGVKIIFKDAWLHVRGSKHRTDHSPGRSKRETRRELDRFWTAF